VCGSVGVGVGCVGGGGAGAGAAGARVVRASGGTLQMAPCFRGSTLALTIRSAILYISADEGAELPASVCTAKRRRAGHGVSRCEWAVDRRRAPRWACVAAQSSVAFTMPRALHSRLQSASRAKGPMSTFWHNSASSSLRFFWILRSLAIGWITERSSSGLVSFLVVLRRQQWAGSGTGRVLGGAFDWACARRGVCSEGRSSDARLHEDRVLWAHVDVVLLHHQWHARRRPRLLGLLDLSLER